MGEIVLQIRYFDKWLSKSHKEVTFFLSNPIPFNEQNHKKQKGHETSDQSLIRYKTSSEIIRKQSSAFKRLLEALLLAMKMCTGVPKMLYGHLKVELCFYRYLHFYCFRYIFSVFTRSSVLAVRRTSLIWSSSLCCSVVLMSP